MRIESVTAHAFGPLVGQRLELAPGMTVLTGLNESGKSSWHAALYSALCGRRRGPGAGLAADRAFAERHRPWSGQGWRVSAVVALDDGRRIELTHDLNGQVDCRATDLALGNDVSGEIMFEGAPDGSRWLGLDRRSFLSTACVRQTELLAVLHNADGLQELLQRAAASTGTNETAAAALERIDRFRRDKVGVDRRGATKPLRAAGEAVSVTTSALAAARDAHGGYLRHSEHVQRLRALAIAADGAAAEAQGRADAVASFGAASDRLARAEEGSRRAAERLAEKARDLQRVEQQCRRAEGLHGQIVAGDDQAQQRQLPPEVAADGDTIVANGVRDLFANYQQARAVLKEHNRRAPTAPNQPQLRLADAMAVGADMLRDLAARIDLVPADVGLDHQIASLQTAARSARADEQRAKQAADSARTLTDTAYLELQAARSRPGPTSGRATAMWVAGGFGAVIGIVLVVLGLAAVGAGVLGVSVAIGVLGVVASRSRSAPDTRTQEQAVVDAQWVAAAADNALSVAVHAAAQADGQCEAAQQQADSAARIRAAVEDDCRSHAVPPNATELRALASAVQAGMAIRQWTAVRDECQARARTSEQDVRAALADRGVEDASAPVQQVFTTYERQCAARSAVNASAREQESRFAQLADALDGATLPWLQRRVEALVVEHAELHEAADEAAETLAQAIVVRDEKAVAAGVEARSDAVELTLRSQAELARAQRERDETRSEAEREDAALAQQAEYLLPVADAEEAHEQAVAAQDRVKALDATLTLTRAFLQSAQNRVHRDVAPVLQAELRKWLPTATGGRYLDVTVDPASLQVKVCGVSRDWRPADRLSIGTTEQIYLLLRVALAARLTLPGRVCPILLDDVTVQADEVRTRALLDLLLQISSERQVVLFAASPIVDSWAAQNLTGGSHAVIALPAPGAA